MAQSKNYNDLSEYQKFIGACEGLKDVLNSKLCDNFLMITNRYVETEIKKEKAKVISPELKELQSMFLQYKKYIDDAKQGQGPGGKMYIDCIIKRIKEIYG